MTFLAPMFLVAGATVAAAIVLLHFLARRRPRPAVLPTARFVPDRAARWPSRAPKPTDLLLLAVRVLAVIALSSAFAGPIRQPTRAITSRIVLVDRSRAVGDERALRDSVLAVLREGDILVAFDTSVRTISANARDTAARLTISRARASLSAALVVAERAAATMRDRADSIELTIVAPFAAEGWDEATPGLRRRWTGRARLIALPLAHGDSSPRTVDVRAPSSDPVSAAAAPFLSPGEAPVRIIRTTPSIADSMWANAPGRVLVQWPRRVDTDTLTPQAIVARDVVLAAPLVRWTDELAPALVIARFADGAPAIIERDRGEGCTRDVGFDLPATGDVALRESARRLIGVLAASCDGRAPQSSIRVEQMDLLRGAGTLLSTSGIPRPSRERSAATAWLLIAAALLLLLEVGVRERAAPR